MTVVYTAPRKKILSLLQVICAAVTSMLLIFLMSSLINQEDVPLVKLAPKIDANFLMPERQPIDPRVDESLPRPLMPPEELVIIDNKTNEALVIPVLQHVSLTDVGGDDGFAKNDRPVQIKPTFKALPKYPPSAVRRKLGGFVDVDFALNAGGMPFDIRVLNAEPVGVFERATLNAVVNWRYDPSLAAEMSGQRIVERVTYVMGED